MGVGSMDDRGRPRYVKHRVAMVRHAPKRSLGVARRCRDFRDQRQVCDKCLCRYEQFGEEGLRDGSSAPLKASVGSHLSATGSVFPPRSPSNAHAGVVIDEAGLQREASWMGIHCPFSPFRRCPKRGRGDDA
jgi:hypothetical protein